MGTQDADALRSKAMIHSLKSRPVYVAVANRMRGIGINIEDFMVLNEAPLALPHANAGAFQGVDTLKQFGIYVGRDTVEGIAFKIGVPQQGNTPDQTAQNIVSNNTLMMRLRSVMFAGKPVFREGNVEERGHWALDLSMAATTGIGFREIAYITDFQQTKTAIPQDAAGTFQVGPNAVFSSQFGETRSRMDISSLHVSINGDICMAHIDHTGFTLGPIPGLSGNDVSLTPDMLQHLFVELFQHDILKIPVGIEFYLPNSRNDFARAGVRASVDLTPKVQLSIDVSKNFRNQMSESGDLDMRMFDKGFIKFDGGTTMAVSISGQHDFLGGGR
jgi:hypothetical protein